MQPPASFDWGRVVTPARWVARILGLVIGGLAGIWTISSAISFGGSDWLSVVLYSLPVVIVVATVFWKGIGEIVGGLALVGIAIRVFFVLGIDPGGLLFYGLLTLSGLLFIGCGWYTVARRHRPAAQIMA